MEAIHDALVAGNDNSNIACMTTHMGRYFWASITHALRLAPRLRCPFQGGLAEGWLKAGPGLAHPRITSGHAGTMEWRCCISSLLANN